MSLQDGNAWNLSDIDTAADSIGRAMTYLQCAGVLSMALKTKLDDILADLVDIREDCAWANKGGAA